MKPYEYSVVIAFGLFAFGGFIGGIITLLGIWVPWWIILGWLVITSYAIIGALFFHIKE